MTTTFQRLAARVVAFGLLLSGCPQVVVAVCGPETCAGCCDSANVCQPSCATPDAGPGAGGGTGADADAGGGQDSGMPPPSDAGAADAGVVDAGTGDAGAPDAGGPLVRVISGGRIQTFVRDTGSVGVPSNLTGTVLKAHSDPDGGPFVSLVGTGRVDGGFSLEGVPSGPYTLQFRNDWFVVTPSETVDLSVAFMGRPNTVSASAPTPLTINATGLAPWTSSSFFALNCTNVGINLDDLRDVGAATPTTGATTASVTVDLSNSATPWLIEAAKGDTVVLTQIQANALPVPHFTATRSATVTGLTQLSGQTSVINATFAPLVPTPVAIDWRLTQFETLRADVHPSATAAGHRLLIHGVAGQTAAQGLWGTTQTLAYVPLQPGAPDFAGTVQLGNPFGPSVVMNGFYATTFAVQVQAPGAAPAPLIAMVVRSGPLASLSGPLLPVVGPPRSITVNGAAPSAAVPAGVTPVLAWTPPGLGTPDSYSVRVSRLTNVAGETRVTPIATILVKAPRLRIPPGLLTPGNTYALTITSSLMGGVDVEKTPFARSGGALSYAEAIIPALNP